MILSNLEDRSVWVKMERCTMALICAHAGFWPPGLEAKTRGSNLDVAA